MLSTIILFFYIYIIYKIYLVVEVTPYIHIFVNHIWEFIIYIGEIDINSFTLQGLEKLNDLTTQYYFRSTNRQNSSDQFLRQLINKRIRIETL